MKEMENLKNILSGQNLYQATVIIFYILASILATFVLFHILVRLYKLYGRIVTSIRHSQGTLLEIKLPRYAHHSDKPNERVAQVKTRSNVAEQMFAELRGIAPSDWTKHLIYRETLSFEIVANAIEINFYVFCSKKLASFVKHSIFAAHPEADIRTVPDYTSALLRNPYIKKGYVRLIGPKDYAPIRTYETFVNDSLNVLLDKMLTLRGKDMIAVQIYATPMSGSWRINAGKYLDYLIESLQQEQKEDKITGQTWVGTSPQLMVDKTEYGNIEKKMAKKGYLIGIRILSSAHSKLVAKSNFDLVALSFSQFDLPPSTVFEPCDYWFALFNFFKYYRLRMQPFIDLPFFRQQFIANTEELASIYHFPGEEINTPKIAWQKYKKAPLIDEIKNKDIFLGYNYYRDSKKQVFHGRKDRRRHFYVVGQTGTGKSEYLKNMVLQDIRNGEGTAFIDPHGDTVEDIIGKITPNRIDDVIYWNPGDVDYPIGYNIMDVDTVEEKNIIINSFIGMLYKLYDPNHTGIMGPMLERTIRNVMLTAMEEKGSTLIEALRLLTNPEFIQRKLSKIKDPLIKTYWTEQMARTSDFHKSETLGYYVSKFDRFVSDITLRNIIGQSENLINFTEIMNSKKILLINLSKGKLGEENTSFLGSLLIPKFLINAMKRANIPEDKRADFYLYVDEFQSFATPDFIQILSEARKYRLNLILANQYIAQIQDEIKNAVFGNTGSLGTFRVGVDDAKYLINHYQPILTDYDLINNGIGNMYLKLLNDGIPTEPFSVSLDWTEVQNIKYNEKIAKLIINASRLKYATPRWLVEREIIQRAKLF
jgi:hypothetical protein